MPAQPRVLGLARLTGAAVAAAVCCGAAASAQDDTRRFAIPAEPLASALLDFALQAKVSIAANAAAQCRPTSNALVGRFRLREGLARLLAASGCTFRITEDGSVIVFKAAPGAGATHPTSPTGKAPVEPEAVNAAREIVVTSGRRANLLDRAPYAVSAITGADLKAAGAADLNDAAPMAASIGMTDLGPGRDKFFIRGLSDSALTGASQSTVGIYLDGARITYNAPDPDLRLLDIQRLEVLRGPQGALYGAGSIGGILHFVTNKPSLDRFSVSADAEVSTTVGGAPNSSLDAVLNAPLAPGRLALRLAGYDEREGGYVDDVRLGLKNVNDVHRRGLRAAARGQIGPDWTVTASVTRQNLNSADTHYVEPAVGRRARDNYLREPNDNDFLAASLNIEGRQGWGELTATSSVLRHQFDSRYDASSALPLFAPGAAVGPSPFDESERAELLVNEVTAASSEDARVRWLAGAFQSVGDNDSGSTLSAPPGASGLAAVVYREERHDLVREFAGYGEASYELAPRLTLTAGGRWFRASVKTRSMTSQPLTGAESAFIGKTSTTGFAPQAGLLYRMDGGATFYLQASEGYRSGGFNTAGLPGQAFADVGDSQPPRRYDGDELWSYEAGAKFSLLDGAARVRAAAFYMVWKGVQSSQLLANGLSYTANIGDGRDLGAEVEVDMRRGEHWRLQANATFADPELTRPNPAFTARPDNGLPGAPRFQAAALASYERQLGRSLSLRLDASFAYVGGSRLTLDATTSPEMGDNTTGRLAAELLTELWSITAFVKSPLGGRSDTFSYGNPFTFRTVAQSTPAHPATLGLQFGVAMP